MFLAIGLFLAATFIGYLFLRISTHTDEGLTAILPFVFGLFFCMYLAISSGVNQQLAVVLALFGAIFGAFVSFGQDAFKTLS